MSSWVCRLRAAAAPWCAILALVFIAACDTSRTDTGLQDAPVATPQPTPPAPPGAAALVRAAGTIDLTGGQTSERYVPAVTTAGAADAGGTPTERVALLLPLSGKFAYLGNPMLNAAQMAVFDVAGGQFELMIFDTAGEPDRAAEAARTAIEQGARLIIGPLLAASTRAAAPWAQAAGVPILSFSSDRAVAGNGTFVLGFSPGEQVDRVMEYASGRGISEFAVIAPGDAYGNVVVKAAQETAARAGGRVTDIQFVDPELSGEAFSIQALGSNPVSAQSLDTPRRALLIAEGGERLRVVADRLEADTVAPRQVQILGTGTWDEPWISSEPALVGGWFAAPPPWARERFVQTYTRTYGEIPPRLAGLAYDATALAAIVSRIIGGMDLTADVLATPAGFMGSEGIFRFTSSGVSERGLAVLEVTPQGVSVISDAPQSFAGT